MLSDSKFEKELKKFDEYLFLGRCLVIRNGEIMNVPTIYYQKERGLKPDVVKGLKRPPCWGDIDELKKMDSWAWKKDWTKKMDDYNEKIKQSKINSAQDQIDEAGKDIYTLANRLERFGGNG